MSDIAEMKKDIAEIKEDVKGLLRFKWQTIGGFATVVFVVTVTIQLLGLVRK